MRMPGEFVPLQFSLSCTPLHTHPDLATAERAGVSRYAAEHGDYGVAELRWADTPTGRVLEVVRHDDRHDDRWESTGITIGVAWATLLGEKDQNGDHVPRLPAHRYPADVLRWALNTVAAELTAHRHAWTAAYAEETANTTPGTDAAAQPPHTPGCYDGVLEPPCEDCASEPIAA